VKLGGQHGFKGQLSSSGSAPSKVTLLRGQSNPVRGWLFPHYRRKVPRTTAQFTDTGRNVDEVATLSLGRGTPVTARLTGPVQAGSTAVRLEAGGKQVGSVRVRRSGKSLAVQAN
jgi:hypothetical protein